jgi:hypothetical protein
MADAMADAPSNVTDELYAELQRRFTEDQLIVLAATAAGKLPDALQSRLRRDERRAVP